jgi:hypothetical protein
MVTVYKEIDIELSDIDTEDLIYELESRNELLPYKTILQNLADAIMMNQTKVANRLISDMIYKETGRIINLD